MTTHNTIGHSLVRAIQPLFAERALFLWAVLIGVFGAGATFLFREAIAALQWLATGHPGSMVHMAEEVSPVVRFLLPVAGGMLAGFVLLWSQKISAQYRSDYMEALALGDGRLNIRQSLMRSLSSLFSVASGGSLGREGSMVQLSALSASGLARLFEFDSRRARLLLACGVAAGITSAYNTPLAGSLFVMEIILGQFLPQALLPMLIASLMANLTMRSLPHYHAIYEMPHLPGVSFEHVLYFVPLGLLMGWCGPAFQGALVRARRLFNDTGLPLPWRLTLGGLGVGFLSVWFPTVWGNGYSVVSGLLHEPAVWTFVLSALLAKVLATMFTTGSGAIGGVFTPTIFVGASIGWLAGAVVQFLNPAWADAPVLFALIGMGAFLAAATGAPWMAIVMIVEMTLNFQILLPLSVACLLAYGTARWRGGHFMYEVVTARNQQKPPRPFELGG